MLAPPLPAANEELNACLNAGRLSPHQHRAQLICLQDPIASVDFWVGAYAGTMLSNFV